MSILSIVEPGALKIAEPGVYYDVSDEAYHLDCVEGGSLSSTGSRTLANKTPAHYRWERLHPRKPKKAFDVGHAFHHKVLGRGAHLVPIDADTYNKKIHQQERDAAYAAGKTPMLRSQTAEVDEMVREVRKHKTAGKLFARRDCRAEVTVIGRDPETGVMCRARIDWLLPIVDGQPIRYVDLKSTDDASQTGMVKSMTNWGYPQQLDHYHCVLRWALGLPDDYPVVASLFGVEKEGPYLVGMGQPDQQAIAWAHEDNRRARHIYARCAATGEWPGHSDEVVPLSLPGWRLNQYENQYPTGLFEPDTTLTVLNEGDHR